MDIAKLKELVGAATPGPWERMTAYQDAYGDLVDAIKTYDQGKARG